LKWHIDVYFAVHNDLKIYSGVIITMGQVTMQRFDKKLYILLLSLWQRRNFKGSGLARMSGEVKDDAHKVKIEDIFQPVESE
jgi:hypothetical protein